MNTGDSLPQKSNKNVVDLDKETKEIIDMTNNLVNQSNTRGNNGAINDMNNDIEEVKSVHTEDTEKKYIPKNTQKDLKIYTNNLEFINQESLIDIKPTPPGSNRGNLSLKLFNNQRLSLGKVDSKKAKICKIFIKDYERVILDMSLVNRPLSRVTLAKILSELGFLGSIDNRGYPKIPKQKEYFTEFLAFLDMNSTSNLFEKDLLRVLLAAQDYSNIASQISTESKNRLSYPKQCISIILNPIKIEILGEKFAPLLENKSAGRNSSTKKQKLLSDRKG